MNLELRDGHFFDSDGRVLLLKGVNLGGSSKLPIGPGPVSFVGRPFPLAEAREHFGRLQRWGLTCLRFVITWEAIEHEGPGIYDRDYLQYLRDVLIIAREFNLRVIIDPHQDVWSRWTGGDGAPLWTLTEVGLDPDNFAATKSAFCMDTYGGRPEDFPKMSWPTNYFKFACATMFSLFWAGSQVAPGVLVRGQPVQDFLQSHYTNAILEVAKVLADLDHVIGFGTMNEPSPGFIGVENLAQHFLDTELKLGLAPTPFQGMCLASGFDQAVEVWSTGVMQYVFNQPDKIQHERCGGKRAWQKGVSCVWERVGVYSVDAASRRPVLHRPAHFATLNFGTDCYVPFATAYAAAVREIMPHAVLFVELPPLEFLRTPFPPVAIPRSVNATHWYDPITLFLRSWKPYFTVDVHTKRPILGRKNVRDAHVRALRAIRDTSRRCMGGAPTLIGECGIPFNLKNNNSYVTGNFSAQVEAMDNTIAALEANLLSYTLWCYTADNTNQWGDLWNLEDLSLFSRDQATSPDRDAGGRAKEGYVRPSAIAIAGMPIESAFNLERAEYVLHYVSTSATKAATEIYVPRVAHYEVGYHVEVSDGTTHMEHYDGYDVLVYTHDPAQKEHVLQITRNADGAISTNAHKSPSDADASTSIIIRRRKLRRAPGSARF
ncbi:glycosyl hydrolase [Achlya hypogyna]|nr:glycosyl hydrolase [Achlya hypogyna]